MQFRALSSLVENLTGVPRTLLIPLVARAHGGTTFPLLEPHDRYAQELLTAMGAEVKTSSYDTPTFVNVLWRTGLIKELGSDFFSRAPQSPGINLGAGLAHYFQWLGNGKNTWIDVDLEQVIDLRKSFLSDSSSHCINQAMDITQPGWWNRLTLHKLDHKRPVFVVCEGVLMYLEPCKVRSIIREFAENAPEGSELILDFVSPLVVGPTAVLRHNEETGAPFVWGVHNGLEVAHLHPRLELLSQHSVSEAYGMGASWADMYWSLWMGGPVYGLAHLRVTEP